MGASRTGVRRLGAGLVLAGAAAAMPGCLISSHSREDLSGKYVSQATFGRIEPGVTTRKWVEGTLGEPSQRTVCEEGSELWKYSYSKRQSSSGSLLFVFGGSSVKETAGSAYVQMRDGVVEKAWRTEE
jgi:hypothetical protein